MGRSFRQRDFFQLHILRFFIIDNNILHVSLLLGVRLRRAIRFEKLLNTAVARRDDVATFLYDAVFGLDFFKEMCYLGGKIGDWIWILALVFGCA